MYFFHPNNKLNQELIDLIIREAYAVEAGKEKSYKAFEEQMAKMQQLYGASMGMGQPGMPGGQMPPMMDPMGMPPMDPMGMPPMMDPMGMPPMDPMGMPPMMDPMAMGDMPMMPGMPPAPQNPTEKEDPKGENGKAPVNKHEEVYTKFMEIMSKSKHQNPMDDPEIQQLMKENAPPIPPEMMDPAMANPMMIDPVFIEKARKKEEEFIEALPKEYIEKIEKEKEEIMKINLEYERKYKEHLANQEKQKVKK